MKRIIVGIVALFLLVSMCACKNTDDNKTQNTDNSGKTSATESESKVESTPTQAEPVGAILSKPEKSFDVDATEKLYMRFAVIEEGKTKEFEWAVNQISEDTYVLYVTDGLLKNSESVYEVTESSGDIKKYEKSVFDENFALASSSVGDLRQEVDTFMELAGFFMYGFGENTGFQYKKQQDFNAPLTGPAFVYDVLSDGENVARVMVNQETGLYVKITTEDGSMNMTLNEYKLSGDFIPQYK